MKKLNQKGMAPVFIVLITLAVVGVGFAGYRVYQNSKDKKQPETSTTQNTTTSTVDESQKEVKTKQFSNADSGISFDYPENWTVNENIEKVDPARGEGYEGQIAVKSPEGLTVYINPSFGGKGGDCENDPSDKPHNTKNCSTLEVLSKEKTSLKIDVGASDDVYSEAYLLRTKFTNGRDSSLAGTHYNVYLENYKFSINSPGPLMGAYLNEGQVYRDNKPYIVTYLESDKLSDQNYLNSDEVKAAEAIYMSLKLQ